MENEPQGYDIFVSYAAVNNEAAAPFDRWVSHFVDALQRTMKASLGGEEPRVHFDLRSVEPNQLLQDIVVACKRSKLFLAISSPAYHVRDWPRQELEAFITGRPDGRRLFVAECLPIADSKKLPDLRQRPGTVFYQLPSLDGGRAPIPMTPGSEAFYSRISDLSASICDQLERMGFNSASYRRPASAPTAIPERADPPPPPVLLAQVTDDLEEERLSVRRYLEQYGIPVLPQLEYPQGGSAFTEAFAEDLEQCALVVQLLGPRPGRIPPDLKVGYPRHQATAATEAGVELMQWRRSGVKREEAPEGAHRELLFGEGVTASTLEQFKKEVLDRVLKPAAVVREKPDFLVFVDAEKADRPAARRMRDALAQVCSVVLPLEDAAGSIQDDFNDNLRDCDALLLVYGDVAPQWVRAQMRQLRKARAGQPGPAGAICYGPPPEKPEVGFTMPGFHEVDCRTGTGDDWSMEPLCSLLPQLRR